jgi:cell division protein FtsX
VFLNPSATDKEIIVVRLAIASVPGVTIDQYLDHRGAFTQLACIFSDTPDALHEIRPAQLPVSFAITSDDADTNSTARLRAIPNVLGVVTPASWSAWVGRIDE